MKRKLLFLGPPGAGKGTQAIKIAQKHGLLHLSTGDLLRNEVKAGTESGKQIELIMNNGQLVSDEIVLSIVEKQLIRQKNGWLLDGFPRNLPQANALESLLDKLKQPIELVLHIELADNVLIKRLLDRGRADDNKETIIERLKIYREKTTPLIQHYSSLGILKSVEGDGDIDQIEKKIEENLI